MDFNQPTPIVFTETTTRIRILKLIGTIFDNKRNATNICEILCDEHFDNNDLKKGVKIVHDSTIGYTKFFYNVN